MLFDTFTQQICKQEKYSFKINNCLKIKENKFYLLSDNNDTYILEIMNIEKNPNFLNFEEINFSIIFYFLIFYFFRRNQNEL